MKKIITFAVGLMLGVLLISGPVFALDLGLDSAKNAAAGAGYDAVGTTDTTLAQNIGSFIRAILTVSGVIFTALVFYAGFLWMNARGEESEVEKSKEIIKAGVIGLIISLAAFGITNLVMKMVSGGGGGGPSGSCQPRADINTFCSSKPSSQECIVDAQNLCPTFSTAKECNDSNLDIGCTYVQ